jgi:hypothetical protein
MRRIAARVINVLLALRVAAPLASAAARGPPTAAKDAINALSLSLFRNRNL